VRFTWREGRIRIFGAGYWRKGKRLCDTDPPPGELVLREDTVKVTLALSRRSVDFFKREAGKAQVPYQRMIRALVDAYTERARKPKRILPARKARS
jgi:hypothetical protein